MARSDFDANYKDAQGITPLIIALQLAKTDYIRALLKKGATFPDGRLTPEAAEAVALGLKDLMDSLWRWDNPLKQLLLEAPHPSIENIVINYLSQNDSALLERWRAEGVFKYL